ncbi:tagatose 1,6-diphosphate aldolase [Geochorda subterranea]|uniref:Tagatose 1,6-diphosphate aldolase n=1 Tax=Geochorda subterranea TaxID=3109564 RepID=A0ABZ1BLX0_9FIRM|nr:tagatose 1,6-diphosphate aldolase [Limnochorda sp. LNt]WRP13679.1 tagatose 1,6-diphosphate aldolase [Limnochorda sp. LNt]
MSAQRRRLSVGKMRGLRQISSPDGLVLLAAMDHRGNLRRALAPEAPDSVGDEEMAAIKVDLARALASAEAGGTGVTGVLVDVEYGYRPLVYTGVLPGHVGALVSIEKTGYVRRPDGRVTELLPGLDPGKLRRMGASGVKLLVYYHPRATTAPQQRELVQRVAEACRQHDVLFVVEALSYPLDPGQEKTSPAFLAEKPDLVAQTAADLTGDGVDLFKAEFPGAVPEDGRIGDAERQRLLEACGALDAASRAPWVLLSEGVSFEAFCTEVEIAGQAGASGFMVGRAVWKDCVVRDGELRRRLLAERATPRMRHLSEMARRHCRPWTERIDTTPPAVEPEWYVGY